MEQRNHHYLPLLLVGKFFLLAQVLIIAGAVVDVGAAFVVPSVGNTAMGGSNCRSFVPRSCFASEPLFNGNEGSANSSRNRNRNRSETATNGTNNKRRQKNKNNNKNNSAKNAQHKKISRPASFAAIRKKMRKDKANEGEREVGASISQNTIDSATISRISRQRNQERQQEQQARFLAKEERKELKVKAYQLSIDTERGFRSNPQQARDMRAIIDRLAELNPTTEPAWSYYGKTNPLTRQLYQSLATEKRKQKENESENSNDDDLASLEGKWILTYTDVPSVVSLATDSNRLGFAKLGRIGQECTPFPDYTVRTIIEWKRPDWVQNLETTLPSAVSGWLFGKAESSVLQKTTLRARATPDDPTSWGVSTVPRVFEVVSSRSSTALYDDDDDDEDSSSSSTNLSFVTDDGLLALDPLKPLKIGLQIAGMNDKKGLFWDDNDDDDDDDNDDDHKKTAGGTSLVTKNGLVALNPFQPWTVGLQMAGKLGKKANEPWKIDEGNENEMASHHHQSSSSSNLFEDIKKRGLVEGVLKQTPIQLPTPDAVASLLEDDKDSKPPQAAASGKQRILYLDDDIRIIGDGQNHVTIESRACTNEDEECWF